MVGVSHVGWVRWVINTCQIFQFIFPTFIFYRINCTRMESNFNPELFNRLSLAVSFFCFCIAQCSKHPARLLYGQVWRRYCLQNTSSALKSLRGQETLSLLKMYELNLERKVAFKEGLFFFHFKGKINFRVLQCGSHLTKIWPENRIT